MIAQAALKLCGADFRLHGRDAEHGLDCIGLVEQCFDVAEIQCDVPSGYSIRGGTIGRIAEAMHMTGFEEMPPETDLIEGDIIIARPSPVQLHMMIKASGGPCWIGQSRLFAGRSPVADNARFSFL